ncbi:MAG: MBL fold metallo-hydrolase [Bacilli bacterium]|nr:MBL fold metallo-hydrolase [Bacilli bacterium]
MILLLIFLGLFLGLTIVGEHLIALTIVTLSVAVFIFWRFPKKFGLIFCVAVFVGVAYSFLNLRLNPNEGSYVGIVIEARSNYYIVWCKFERLIVYENNNSKEIGDIIRFSGNLEELVDTSLESEFNFYHYLRNLGVSRELVVSGSDAIFSNFIKLKAYKLMFLNLFDSGARDYIDALLFNIKNYDSESLQLASSLNLIYLFSNAGIYLSLLFRIVEYFLFLRFDKRGSRIGSLLILSWYLIFTLPKVGVRRILYLKVFSLVNEGKLKKRFSYVEVISLVGITMLLLNHYLARQSSFYLGFVLSLTFLLLRSTLNRGKRYQVFLKTSVFLFLFMLPLSLMDQHEFHLLAIPFQALLTPMMFLLMFSGVISFYSFPIKPYFNALTSGINYTLKGFSYVDLTVNFKDFNEYYLIIYYLLLFLIVYYFEAFYYARSRLFTLTLLATFMIQIVPYEYLYADSICFLNVGQGDCCLVRHNAYNIMIDTGGLTYKDIATEVSIPYLKKKGIYQLDYVFISHDDYDHCGALNSLKNNFNVKHIVDNQSPFKITISDLVIENLNAWASEAKDSNDASQVLLLTAAHRRVLMMGDASTSVEKKLMNAYPKGLNIDLLKLGHHGSKTSSSYEFLKWVDPSDAIISVGKNNYYGHPHKEVLMNLESLKIPYHRTDEVGSVIYYGNNFLRA